MPSQGNQVESIATRQPSRGKRKLRLARAAVALLLFLTVALLIYNYVRENLHPLAGGRAWRSAQPSAAMLRRLAAEQGLRSVLNLRGANAAKKWYWEELAAAQELGLEHFDVTLDSQNAPTSGELKELLRIFDTCPRPLLIHCESGSDRTGMVSLVYELSQEDVALADAENELSIAYGHFPWRRGYPRFRAFLQLYKDWLAANAWEHDSERFRVWATSTYKRPDHLGGPDVPVYPPWKVWVEKGKRSSPVGIIP